MALRGHFVRRHFLDKFLGRQVLQRRMSSVSVEILLPCFQRFFGFGQRAEERFVQGFVPQLAVEG